MEEKRHPFSLGTEASLNLSDDPELLDLMARAGFEEVFVGIESPNAESLEECKKTPNRNRDLLASVRTLQKAGLQVQAGFIVGFDNDPAVHLRHADPVHQGERHRRRDGRSAQRPDQLAALSPAGEGRTGCSKVFSGNNTDFSMNFVPRMNPDGASRRVPEDPRDHLLAQGVLPAGHGVPPDP